jgi:hypothetical protein
MKKALLAVAVLGLAAAAYAADCCLSNRACCQVHAPCCAGMKK